MRGQSAVDGAIGGTVEDRQVRSVSEAKIVVRSIGTNAEQTLVSDAAGYFAPSTFSQACTRSR